MSALAQPHQLNTSTDSVTSISVNARIDYIFRFSKHAILVVDESAQECSSVGYQFLDQLSPQHNAAFISSSSKLNNIQIRCRIIEQLFSGSVFDPEQSLAVSIVNLLNANPQKLAIVIDNVQFSSLQIIHELTQLALIAKKAQLEIEVLMLGDYTAGKILAVHKELFNKKISILSKQSGQLLSLNAKEFKASQSWLTLTLSKKWIITLTSISLLAVAAVLWLQQQEIFSFSKLPNNIVSTAILNDGEDKMVLSGVLPKNTDNLIGINSEVLSEQVASSSYIFNILTGIITIKPKAISQPADVSDIVSAIAAFEIKTTEEQATEVTGLKDNRDYIQNLPLAERETNMMPKPVKALTNNALVASQNQNADTNTNINNSSTIVVTPIQKEVSVENTTAAKLLENKLGSDYFKSFSQGFVIQISGFTQGSIMQKFLADFNAIAFQQYKRILNDEEMTVITSKHYKSHAEAEQAMYALPSTILARQPWIKSITAINNEINAFERSQ